MRADATKSPGNVLNSTLAGYAPPPPPTSWIPAPPIWTGGEGGGGGGANTGPFIAGALANPPC